MKHFSNALLLGLALLAAGSAGAEPLAVPPARAGETARLVATMLVAGRSVVAAHQSLINDPDQTDKGFTPEYFERLLLREFEKSSGRSLASITDPQVRAVVQAAIDASKRTVLVSQGMINAPGKGFKGFIPALYGRMTGQILKGTTGIVIKQTTFLPRNDYNLPDEYELAILKSFQETRPKNGLGEQVGANYRYLQPMYIEAPCLQCHGEPKGQLDITGRAMEGYKLGELRGAISVDIPIR